MVSYTQIIHFNGIFPDKNHPFLDLPIDGNHQIGRVAQIMCLLNGGTISSMGAVEADKNAATLRPRKMGGSK